MSAIERVEPRQVAVSEQTSEAVSLLAVIERAATNPDVDIDKMERLMQMHERIQAKRAESAYNAAMSAAQAEMGRVAVDAENKQTRSSYATYGALDRALRPLYTKHGFALSFDTGEGPAETLRVVCHVSHRDGYTRSHHIDMPADGKGAKGGDVMTKTHATGAASSYGMRYLLKMIFNVAIGEDDRDGNDEPVVTQQQVSTIEDLIAATEADRGKLLAYAKAESVEAIRAKDFGQIVKMLKAKMK